MATQAHNAANVRYNKRQDQITLRPDRETGQKIRAAALAAGVPLQRWIIGALLDRIAADDRQCPGQ